MCEIYTNIHKTNQHSVGKQNQETNSDIWYDDIFHIPPPIWIHFLSANTCVVPVLCDFFKQDNYHISLAAGYLLARCFKQIRRYMKKIQFSTGYNVSPCAIAHIAEGPSWFILIDVLWRLGDIFSHLRCNWNGWESVGSSVGTQICFPPGTD